MKTFNKDTAGKIKAYFVSTLNANDYKNGWMKMDCPYCGKEKKFGVHIDKNKTNCFVCGGHGPPIRVIMEVEKFTKYNEVYKLLNTLEAVEVLRVYKEDLKPIFGRMLLPDFYTPIGTGNHATGRAARQYLINRGFDITELGLKGIGYCWKGKFMGRIIIPYYQAGQLVYFTARTFINEPPKFKNPTILQESIGKSLLIYNADALAMYKTIRIVESATNALTRGDSTIAIAGKSISTYQLSLIIQSPCTRVIIILDPDGYEEALELGLKLINLKKVKVVKLPDGTDVNSLGKAETIKYEKESEWETWNSLVSKLQNVKKSELAYP